MGKKKATNKEQATGNATDWQRAWADLRKEFEQRPTQTEDGILRYGNRTDSFASQPPENSAIFQDERSSLQSIAGRLYHEANLFNQIFSSVTNSIRELGKTSFSLEELQDTIARLFDNPAGAAPRRKPPGKTLEKFGTPHFSSISPDVTSGLDSAWRNILSLPATTGLPFSDHHIKTIENSLFGSIGTPLPLGEIGFGEKWHKNSQQSFQQLFLFYQSLQEFCSFLYLMLPEALEVLDQLIQNHTISDDRTSLVSLYDLWLQALEEAYRRITESDEYSRTFGNLINSFITLRLCGTGFTEQVSGVFNLPTQKELDHAHQTQHVLRKQHSEIREELDEVQVQRKIDEANHDAQMQQLTSEVEQLKDQINQLKNLIEDKKTDISKDKTDPDSDRMH